MVFSECFDYFSKLCGTRYLVPGAENETIFQNIKEYILDIIGNKV